MKFGFPPGATPLDPDDVAGLIPTHITLQGELNEWELDNIARGEQWAFGQRRLEMLTLDFALQLHKKMFGDTWRWAGRTRAKEVLPVGVTPGTIRSELVVLMSDVKEQLGRQSMDITEVAARFHHRLVAIHPFPNGNGRHARTMTDLLVVRAGRPRFQWGANLEREGEARAQYIAALQAADRRDLGPLFRLLGIKRTP